VLADAGSIPAASTIIDDAACCVRSRAGGRSEESLIELNPATQVFTLSGRPVRWRITPISARALSAVSRAHGNEPRPPDRLTATAMAASVAPAIGA